jgi:hypothetical protein
MKRSRSLCHLNLGTCSDEHPKRFDLYLLLNSIFTTGGTFDILPFLKEGDSYRSG